MNVACPECRSIFRVDPAKVTSTNLRARCSVCGAVIPVGESVQWGDEIGGGAVETTRSRQRDGAASGATPSRTPVVVGTAGLGGLTGSGRPITPPFSAPAFGTPSRDTLAAGDPARETSPTSASASPSVRSAERSRHDSPAFGAPLAPPPSRPPSLTPVAGGAGGVPSGAIATPAASTALSSGDWAGAGATPAAGAPRPPINPFLANDPSQKARRLARALVSDMVAYHPSKREDGLRSGTLKQLFREEIKKSYEEYVEQVGREFAESSMHFQDALNDVLAGGRKIF